MYQMYSYFHIFFNIFSFLMHFCWDWHLALYILSDSLGIRNLGGLNDLNSLTTTVASMTSTTSFHQKKITELVVSINPDTKMIYLGLLMWDGSWKIQYFIGFWHPFSWRLWRARCIKKIKIDELGINVPISWTHRIQNTSKNSYLCAHKSRIAYQSLLCDTLPCTIKG
jgi:hypothetical protein